MGCVNSKNANDPKKELSKNEKVETKPPIEIPYGIPAERFLPSIRQVDAAPKVETAPPAELLKQAVSSKLQEAAHPVSQVKEALSGVGQEAPSIPPQLQGVVGQANLIKSVVPLSSDPPQISVPLQISNEPLHPVELMPPIDASNIKIEVPPIPPQQHHYEDPYKALISEVPLPHPHPLQAPPKSNLHERPQISKLAQALPRSEVQGLNATVKDMEDIYDSIGRDKSRVQASKVLEVVHEHEDSEVVNDQNVANYAIPINFKLSDIRVQ